MMNEKEIRINSDNVFYHIWYSIRADWGYGVIIRGQCLLEILPYTSLNEEFKNDIKEHIKKMINFIADDPKSNPYSDFDGRDWARRGKFTYQLIPKQFKNFANLDLTSNEQPDGEMYYFPKSLSCGYEDAIELYYKWRNKNENRKRN